MREKLIRGFVPFTAVIFWFALIGAVSGIPQTIRVKVIKIYSGTTLTIQDAQGNAGPVFTDAGTTINAAFDGALTLGSSLTVTGDGSVSDDLIVADVLTVGSCVGCGNAFPVGAIFISISSTNPGTSLGYGTWTAFGTGQVLVGIDVGQTEFDVAEETGGAKTHTLTSAEMPNHTHSIQIGDTDGAAGIADRSSSAVTSMNTGATGGGGAHNNLQPYIVVYMWKRTA